MSRRRAVLGLEAVVFALVLVCGLASLGCESQSGRPEVAGEQVDTTEVARPATASAEQPQSAEAAGPGRPTPVQLESRFEWLEGAFLPSMSTVEAIRADFGEPDSLILDTRPNAYDSAAVDSIYRVVYSRGMEAWVYRGNGGREFILNQSVTSPGLIRDSTVDVGMAWSDVVDRIGPPSGDLEGVAFYSTRGEVDEEAYIHVEDGIVRRIAFSYYSG